MSLSNQQIENLITRVRDAVTAVLQNDKAAAVMDEYGFSRERLEGLLDLSDDVQDAYVDQKVEYAEAEEATDDFNEKRGRLYGMLSEHRQIARTGLKEQPAAIRALGARGRTERYYEGLVQQAIQFYDVLDEEPDIASTLAPYSITPEARDTAQTLIGDLTDAKANQKSEQMEAQTATARRNRLVGELRGRSETFFTMAHVGLGKHEQLSEIVGIIDNGQ